MLRGRSKKKERPKKRGSKGVYRYPEFTLTLKRFWLATDQMCGRNLKVAIPIWLSFYEQEHGAVGDRVKNDLLRISHATIDRILHPYRTQHPKGRGGIKPGTLLGTQIPIRTDFWDVDRPGYLEGDKVQSACWLKDEKDLRAISHSVSVDDGVFLYLGGEKSRVALCLQKSESVRSKARGREEVAQNIFSRKTGGGGIF